MVRFCTKCGKPLDENGKCNCVQQSFITKLKAVFGRTTEQIDFLERNKAIVPNCVKPDEGEQTIKQYKLAKLRSKIRGQYAEGRLQITNKRLLFRAAGVSSLGKTTVQHEFNINDISGVDIQKGSKISVLNIIGALLLSFILTAEAQSVLETLYLKTGSFASFAAFFLFVICTLLFFVLKRKFWIKLSAFSCGIGALIGSSASSLSAWDIVYGLELVNFKNILIFILAIGWFYLLLQVCFVPDLIFIIKTTGAGEVIQLRRKIWGLFMKQSQEYTGFSEVLPWEDTEKIANELGAIINDIQTMGDMAIDKWKE